MIPSELPGGAGGRRIRSLLESYCKAWNESNLDGIFALFREDAEYDAASKRLEGRSAIRRMYQEAFEMGVARELVAETVQLRGGTWGVVLYRQAQAVALKEFRFSGDLIVGHNLIEDRDTIDQKVDRLTTG